MHNMKNKIKAIIFDMDGTIINTEHIWQKISKDFLASKGITKLTEKQIESFKDIASGGLIKYSEITKNIFNLPESVEQMVNEKIALSLDYMNKYPVEFIDGFQSFHKKLQQSSISTGIATNASLKTLNLLIKKLNLNNYFGKNIYCFEHVNNKAKPDPALFLHTAQKLNVKPSECIIFEDSISGFKAAQKAKIKCIGIKNKHNENVLHNADFVINNYHEAEEILKNI